MRSNWIKSFVINIIVLGAITGLTTLHYETNDDYGLALRIQAGYDDILLINRFLARFLVIAQEILGNYNAFVIFQILLSFLAFLWILKILLDMGRSMYYNLFSIIVVTIFAFGHYAEIQFTKTAALMVIAGGLILVDAFLKKRNMLYTIFGIFFFYVGASLRFINTYVAMAFAGMVLCFLIWDRREALKTENHFTKRFLALQLVVALLVAGTYVWKEASYSGDEMQAYKAYNRYRADIIDYPVYQNYDAMEEEMKDLGISKNDLFLIDHWFLDYDGAASPDNLRSVDDVYKEKVKGEKSISATIRAFIKGTLTQLRSLAPRGCHLILLCIIALGAVLYYRPRYWICILGIGALAILGHMYIYYVGRTVSRAFYVVDICAAFSLLYLHDAEWGRPSFAAKNKGNSLKIISCTIGCLLMALLIIPIYTHCEEDLSSGREHTTSDEVRDYTSNRPDEIFVFGTREKGHDPAFQTPLRLPPKGAESNVLTFGSWGTGSTYASDKMHSLGINNVFSDIIDNDRASVIMNKYVDEFTTYLNKWYGSHHKEIVMTKIDTVDGLKVWTIKSVQQKKGS